MKDSYKKEAVSGVKWTGLSTLIIAGGNLLFILYLTRVLSKVDFGLFALVNVVSVLAAEFVDMGIGQAIIQKKEVDRNQLSTLYWINLGLGLLVASVVLLCSPLIANFYESPDLVPLLQWTSIGFFVGAMGSQFQALFQRALLFKRMAFIDLSAFAGYLAVTIYFVYLGYGVYSLVWGGLVRIGLKAFLSMGLGAFMHFPKLYFKYGNIKSFLTFGSFRSASFILTFLANQLDAILIGKLIGVGELGIYDVLKRLVTQPLKIISPLIKKVAFPILAKVQSDRERATSMFQKVFQLLNLLRYPIFLGLVLCAEEITLILGAEWHEHYRVLQVLSLMYLLNTIQNFIGQSMVAMGKSSWGFYNNLARLPLQLAAILIGSLWGLIGIALGGLVLAVLIVVPRYFIFVKRLYDVSFASYMTMIFREILFLGLWVVAVQYAVDALELSTILSLSVKTILFGAGILILYRFGQPKLWNYFFKLLKS